MTMPTSASLSLFQPSSDGALSVELSLLGFFRAYVKPQVLVLAAARNLDQYEESLALWEAYTCGPSLAQIDQRGQALCAAFLRGLRARTWRDEPLSPNTIRKHCIHVQAVIDLAGPSSRTLPAAAKLIGSPPLILKPKVYVPEVEDVFTLDEIRRQYEAADVVPRTEYWRALFRFAYNSAFRAATLFALQPKWLVEDELGWWAKVPGTAIKGGRGRRFYLTASAMTALAPLLAGAKPTDRILARPVEKSWFYHSLHAIQEEARLPHDRQFGLHALRKACVTELSAINPMAASWHAGHSARNITRDHYTHPRALVAAVKLLPEPVWRSRRQKLLF